MTDQNPITPPQELVASLRNSAPHGIRDAGVTREIWLIHNAFAAGADQELEACCGLLQQQGFDVTEDLRAARRPKPPSLKEQALEALAAADGADHPVVATVLTADQHAIIRRALEALPDE